MADGQASTVSARFPDLAGKAAIVTGASRGIGAGIAEFLGRQGMKLALTARSADAGEAVAARLRAAGADCLFVSADLVTAEGAKSAFDAAVKRFERIHLLVNNAANVAGYGSILEVDEGTYRVSLEANARMIYGLTRLVAQHMVEKGGGSIINISSVGGLRPHRRHFGYDASKGAMDAMTRGMAIDLAPHKIRVNSVAPGWIIKGPVKPGREADHKRAAAGIPLGRAGTPEDVAAAVAFLASDAAAYITGQVLYVDGGLVTQLTPPGIFI